TSADLEMQKQVNRSFQHQGGIDANPGEDAKHSGSGTRKPKDDANMGVQHT
ncbi:hypothetical protein NDU88_001337, partial [Pleurodeles waltl]